MFAKCKHPQVPVTNPNASSIRCRGLATRLAGFMPHGPWHQLSHILEARCVEFASLNAADAPLACQVFAGCVSSSLPSSQLNHWY
jgi:hypothetical protein